MKLAALTLLATASSTEAFGSFGGNKKAAAPAPVAKVSQLPACARRSFAAGTFRWKTAAAK